jgi:hypothetical protein
VEKKQKMDYLDDKKSSNHSTSTNKKKKNQKKTPQWEQLYILL